MTIDWIRDQCLALPHVTEDVKWEHDLVFSIGDKMFAAANLEPGDVWLSFKASPEVFAELSERPDIRPAPIWRAPNGWPWNTPTPSIPATCSGFCARHTSWSFPS